jgi:hypothetical protein
MDQAAPLDGENSKKRKLGNHAERRNRTGRPLGVRPRLIREREELMRQLGGDPPHVALLKIGRDQNQSMSVRTSALAAAGPFFAPKYAPMAPPRFLAGEPDLGRLTDAQSAVVFVASTVECARTGKLDAEWTRLFLDAADVFVRLYDKLNLETEVERHRELTQVGDD